eukprot:scaffold210626_cov37-Prasinocladus_malaysianus.AAC.1
MPWGSTIVALYGGLVHSSLSYDQGEVAVRELSRAEAEGRASERLGIKQAELEEAERRLMVHRDALEAEMAEALAEASAGFEAYISNIQRKSAEVGPVYTAQQPPTTFTLGGRGGENWNRRVACELAGVADRVGV